MPQVRLSLTAKAFTLVFALASGVSGAEVPGSAKRVASLMLRVGLEKTVIAAADPIRFELSIQNPLDPCYWAAIDPIIAVVDHGDRPAAKVAIELLDSQGRRVALQGGPAAYLAEMRDGDLLNLGCGKFFGEVLELGKTPGATWKQSLPPGRYAVTFTLTLGVRSYFESHPELAELEAKRRYMKKESLLSMLPEQTLRSEKLEFVVSP